MKIENCEMNNFDKNNIIFQYFRSGNSFYKPRNRHKQFFLLCILSLKLSKEIVSIFIKKLTFSKILQKKNNKRFYGNNYNKTS